MESRIAPSPSISPSLPQLPGWTLPGGREPSEVDAAFATGITLKSLDDLVYMAPAWAGCWRARQVLKCAAIAVLLMGRNENEQALRDALLLTAAGDDPSPAERVVLAFKRLSAQKPGFSSKSVAEFVELLGFSFDDSLAEVVDFADAALQSGRPAPFAAADLVTAIQAIRPDAEPLAWTLAEALIAEKLKWPFLAPLLMAERYGPAFRTLGGRGRVRPGEPAFLRAVCLALVEGTGAALQSAIEISRRADTLITAAPKVRTKGAGAVIQKLLEEDAVAASSPVAISPAGRQRAFSNGSMALVRCVNSPADRPSASLGCDDEPFGHSRSTAWQIKKPKMSGWLIDFHQNSDISLSEEQRG